MTLASRVSAIPSLTTFPKYHIRFEMLALTFHDSFPSEDRHRTAHALLPPHSVVKMVRGARNRLVWDFYPMACPWKIVVLEQK